MASRLAMKTLSKDNKEESSLSWILEVELKWLNKA